MGWAKESLKFDLNLSWLVAKLVTLLTILGNSVDIDLAKQSGWLVLDLSYLTVIVFLKDYF